MTAHGVRRAALVLVAAAALVAAGLWHSPAPAAATTKLGANIVKIAKAEAANKAHNHEIGGYNCNYYTTALKLAGTGARCSNHWKTEEWCADFSKWVWAKAGANTTYATPAAASFETYGKKHHTWHTGKPQAGDAIVFPGHVGLVVSTTAKTVTYISGNTYNPKDGKDDVVRQETISRSSSRITGYSTPLAK